ncbi:MAG: hypothetical protein ACO1QB_02575 [Verrucomicrobiales bacterium]
MADDLELNPPEHPRFPRNAEELQDPNRSPSEHERRVWDVFLRFKEIPSFDELPQPTEAEKLEASNRLDALLIQPEDIIKDQDERVLQLFEIIADYPHIFGKVGYFMAAEIMGASKNNMENSEFRRAFIRDYLPALPEVREYLRQVAGLRRRGRGAKYDPANVPKGKWGGPERFAAAREQMELVQGLADHHVMEKYWRTLEIVCAYPDLFKKEQYDQLASKTGIDQAWRAHLSKAREDWNYYRGIQKTAAMFRSMIDSAIEALKRVIVEGPPQR